MTTEQPTHPAPDARVSEDEQGDAYAAAERPSPWEQE